MVYGPTVSLQLVELSGVLNPELRSSVDKFNNLVGQRTFRPKFLHSRMFPIGKHSKESDHFVRLQFSTLQVHMIIESDQNSLTAPLNAPSLTLPTPNAEFAFWIKNNYIFMMKTAT